MAIGEMVDVFLTIVLILIGGLLALGFQAGRTPIGRAYNRRLGLALVLMGASYLGFDVGDWFDLPVALSVLAWIMGTLFAVMSIWLSVKTLSKYRDFRE